MKFLGDETMLELVYYLIESSLIESWLYYLGDFSNLGERMTPSSGKELKTTYAETGIEYGSATYSILLNFRVKFLI